MAGKYLAETNQAFVEAIKRVENNLATAKKRGEYKDGKWFPGKSPEGGLPTLAWGHKLTQKEWSEKKILSKDFRYGLTDEEVNQVLINDLIEAEKLASSDWDKYIGFETKMTWDTLPDKYKGVLVNLVFNAGPLVKHGKWIWNTVARGIKMKDDAVVVRGMVTSYKRPDGVRVQLTTRAIEIAKGLNLPWQILK